MKPDWWQMPGPAELVQRVVSDLEAGQSVVVGLPAISPPGFAEAVRRGLDRPRPQREWRPLPELPLELPSVADWLWEQWYANEIPPLSPAAHAQELVDHPEYESAMVWVPDLDGQPASVHIQWFTFATAYQRAQATLAGFRRSPLLLICAVPAALMQLPAREPLLGVHTYRTYQTGLDLLLFLTANLSPVMSARGEALRCQLLVQTAAVLFPADPVLALAFVEDCGSQMLEAADWVAQRRQAPEWQPAQDAATGTPNERWARGWLGHVDGQPWTHLCAPGGLPLPTRVRQGCLLAQIQIILPWLEQQRWLMLNRAELNRYLSQQLPWQPPSEWDEDRAITDVFELEFTHILTLLPVPRRGALSDVESEVFRNSLKQLKRWRNKLSHLTPLCQEELDELVTLANGLRNGDQ